MIKIIFKLPKILLTGVFESNLKHPFQNITYLNHAQLFPILLILKFSIHFQS